MKATIKHTNKRKIKLSEIKTRIKILKSKKKTAISRRIEIELENEITDLKQYESVLERWIAIYGEHPKPKPKVKVKSYMERIAHETTI